MKAMFEIVWSPPPDPSVPELSPDRTLAYCPACGDATPKDIALVARGAAADGTDWVLLRCAACGTRFAADRSVHDYGHGDPYGVALDLYLEQGAGIDVMLSPLAWIDPGNIGSLIEIGGGFGFISDIGRLVHGWDCVGYDPSPMAVAGRELLGLDNRAAYFGDDTPLPRPFDLAFASEVIEHVPDPAAFLAVVRRAVGEAGIVVLTTPNGEALRPETPSSMFNAILSPGLHLTLFTAAGLEALLRAAGFPVVRVVAEGMSLQAMAGFDAGRLRDKPRDYRRDYVDYLRQRLKGPLHPRLESGMRGRLFRDLVQTAKLRNALDEFAQLVELARTRYGIDLNNPVAIEAAAAETVDLAELAVRGPLNLCGVLYHRAVIANNLERDPERTVDCCLAAAAAGARLRRALNVEGMDDGETGDLIQQSLLLAFHLLPVTDPSRAADVYRRLARDPARNGIDADVLVKLGERLANGFVRHYQANLAAALFQDLATQGLWDAIDPFRPQVVRWAARNGDWTLCFALGLAAEREGVVSASECARAFGWCADRLLDGPAGTGDPVAWTYWWEAVVRQGRALHLLQDDDALEDLARRIRNRLAEGPSPPEGLAEEAADLGRPQRQ